MITKKTWLGVVVGLGFAPTVLLCAVNGFVPALENVIDPLGRPSQLSLEVIDSADQFDTLTSILVPKHAQLATDIQALTPLAHDLEGLTAKAAELTGQSKTLNISTGGVSTIAAPLPGLVANVTARANQAGPTVAGLSMAVGSVTTQLEAINTGLTTVSGTLGTLEPKATAIAATLANVEEEARHVQALGPLLSVIGPPVNSLNLPPLGVAATPNP
ncbi:hypothetical protein EEB12_29515 [Rhodococcus sp. WS1]|uniref:hypothetical protein n=1 Tax=unclassified Rhodococcus (in: high G+C Gram-positive bacteria) TaxID=192944 RepID=UPI001144292B|nr:MULTISPECIES: hypothetical protein [unclassified Rhodococcus (in: high G+C Gram-positive bacteria)]ROZ52958.1 hypothetical protein EEB12_29515 [Rhodococcus sp. WS1]TQC36048.1 hypothetical protein EEB16_21085 [Rhodococcus sp. WS7]